MNKVVEQYIENVKKEVLKSLNLCETVYYPVVFKSQLDRERFPCRDEYTANVLHMMTAYKRLVGYGSSEEEYDKLSNEYWAVEVVEDGKDYFLFKRYKNAPVEISDDDFWELVKYAKIAPNSPLNLIYKEGEIIEKIDSLLDAVESLEEQMRE